jgi:hypothetical protein
LRKASDGVENVPCVSLIGPQTPELSARWRNGEIIVEKIVEFLTIIHDVPLLGDASEFRDTLSHLIFARATPSDLRLATLLFTIAPV